MEAAPQLKARASSHAGSGSYLSASLSQSRYSSAGAIAARKAGSARVSALLAARPSTARAEPARKAASAYQRYLLACATT